MLWLKWRDSGLGLLFDRKLNNSCHFWDKTSLTYYLRVVYRVMYHLFVCVNQSKLSVLARWMFEHSTLLCAYCSLATDRRRDRETNVYIVLLPAMFMFCANTRSTHKSTLTNMYIVVVVCVDRSRPFHARMLTQTFQFSHPPKPPKSIAQLWNCCCPRIFCYRI